MSCPSLAFSAISDIDSSTDHSLSCDRLLKGVLYPYHCVIQSPRCLCIHTVLRLFYGPEHGVRASTAVSGVALTLASRRCRHLSLLWSTLERRTSRLSLSVSTSLYNWPSYALDRCLLLPSLVSTWEASMLWVFSFSVYWLYDKPCVYNFLLWLCFFGMKHPVD